MPAPTVAARTNAVYAKLPEHYRDADAQRDYPLLRYLSTLLDQLTPVDALTGRIHADDGGSSDLVNAAGADASWFPWLAQLLGVDLTGLDVTAQRAALVDPSTSWDHGTPGALADAAKGGLSGTKAITITPHYGGLPYQIGLGTKDSETLILDTFAELKAAAPTWADLHAIGTFAQALAPGPVVAAERERPAGYRLVRYSTGA